MTVLVMTSCGYWSLHVTTDTLHIVSWYIQKVLFLCQMLSHFVSVDSYQHQRSLHFVFDFPKLNLCQHIFTLYFSSMHVNISYFCNLHMWINTFFSHADIAGSFRVSLVVGVHSIWAHVEGECFFWYFYVCFRLISGSGSCSGFKIRFRFCTQLAV